MKQVRIAFVGICGYGKYGIELIHRFAKTDDYCFAAFIDPFFEHADFSQEILDLKVPCFHSLEEFYASDSADLVIIASPVHLHKEHCMTALSHGSHILCEKPLTPLLEDSMELQRLADQRGLMLAVGFQLSFCSPILELKQLILAGALGKPVSMSTCLCWHRNNSYYNNWKGRLADQNGNLIMDSVLTNAAAHYLHNLFFLLGDQINCSAMPEQISAELYRIHSIETFDTAFLKGSFSSGCSFSLGVTHAASHELNPCFHFVFENATITSAGTSADLPLLVTMKNGSSFSLGSTADPYHTAEKFLYMIDLILNRKIILPCNAATTFPQLAVCNALFTQAEIAEPASEFTTILTVPEASIAMPDLNQAIPDCTMRHLLPSEIPYLWAQAPSRIDLHPYFEKLNLFQKGDCL